MGSVYKIQDDLSIYQSKEEDRLATDNLIIEGDNLDVCNNFLYPQYRNKIDCIFFDPPYNTNVAYIKYADKFSSRKWTLFISRRIKSCMRLLSKKGFICFFIDDCEIFNTLKILYKNFQKSNVKIFIWPKTNVFFDQNRKEKQFSNYKNVHEYVVFAFKNYDTAKFEKIDVINTSDPIKKSIVKKVAESILANLGTNASAKDELNEIFGSRDKFATPKPTQLFKSIIKMLCKNNSIILDIFAGSGTAGQAVMEINKEGYKVVRY